VITDIKSALITQTNAPHVAPTFKKESEGVFVGTYCSGTPVPAGKPRLHAPQKTPKRQARPEVQRRAKRKGLRQRLAQGRRPQSDQRER
jgi:hypothetical protein